MLITEKEVSREKLEKRFNGLKEPIHVFLEKEWAISNKMPSRKRLESLQKELNIKKVDICDWFRYKKLMKAPWKDFLFSFCLELSDEQRSVLNAQFKGKMPCKEETERLALSLNLSPKRIKQYFSGRLENEYEGPLIFGKLI